MSASGRVPDENAMASPPPPSLLSVHYAYCESLLSSLPNVMLFRTRGIRIFLSATISPSIQALRQVIRDNRLTLCKLQSEPCEVVGTQMSLSWIAKGAEEESA